MWAWLATGAAAMPGIVGGIAVDDPMDPVVAVVSDGVVICSGTLLHPEWVLTAAHCVDAAPTEVWWGADVRAGTTSQAIGVADGIAHPEHLDREYDVGLLHLDAPASGALAALVDVAPEVGDVLTAYGFGATTDGASDGGVKRSVDVDVLDVQSVVVRTYRGGANVCSGDSGGPLIRPGSTPMEVVAVTSFVDPSCLGGTGGGSRADAIMAFVADHVPPVDLEESGAPDSGGPPPPDCACRTSAGSAGWPWIVALLVRGRDRRARPTRGRSAASPSKADVSS